MIRLIQCTILIVTSAIRNLRVRLIAKEGITSVVSLAITSGLNMVMAEVRRLGSNMAMTAILKGKSLQRSIKEGYRHHIVENQTQQEKTHRTGTVEKLSEVATLAFTGQNTFGQTSKGMSRSIVLSLRGLSEGFWNQPRLSTTLTKTERTMLQTI